MQVRVQLNHQNHLSLTVVTGVVFLPECPQVILCLK